MSRFFITMFLHQGSYAPVRDNCCRSGVRTGRCKTKKMFYLLLLAKFLRQKYEIEYLIIITSFLSKVSVMFSLASKMNSTGLWGNVRYRSIKMPTWCVLLSSFTTKPLEISCLIGPQANGSGMNSNVFNHQHFSTTFSKG